MYYQLSKVTHAHNIAILNLKIDRKTCSLSMTVYLKLINLESDTVIITYSSARKN